MDYLVRIEKPAEKELSKLPKHNMKLRNKNSYSWTFK